MRIEVVEHRAEWAAQFEALRAQLAAALGPLAVAIEHVGSTSVPGLWAKPIVDLDVVIGSRADLPAAARALAGLGYVHQGDLGVPDREAFRGGRADVAHHLYVCVEGSLGLQNHLLVREALRGSAALRERYAAVKRALAARFPEDIDAYVDGKTALLTEILEGRGLDRAALDAIARINSLERC
jgi:GrpB-like predicted nucleotidyltransferase (UPF0157 family)